MRPVPVGESAVLDVVVTPEMTVRFDELGPVHPVYATYSMAKHFEEAGRKLLLRHLEPGEAGIGSSLSVEHLAPARVGDAVRVTARCVELRGNRLTCECTAVDAEGRVLGRGTTGQVVLTEEAVQARLGDQARGQEAARVGGEALRRSGAPAAAVEEVVRRGLASSPADPAPSGTRPTNHSEEDA